VRLIGYRAAAGIRVAALARDGQATDLAGVDEFYADPGGWLAKAAQLPADLVVDELELAPPVRPAARILCVGLNYRAHAAEGGFDLPEYPAVFARWTPSLTVSGTPVPVPADEPGLDWEGTPRGPTPTVRRCASAWRSKSSATGGTKTPCRLMTCTGTSGSCSS
jgi:2,4-diketo-3-deoxy-L-fuconate hydrolase